MAKNNKMVLKNSLIKKECRVLVRKFNRGELFPPPPTPSKTVEYFKCESNYLGNTLIVRLCIYSKDNYYRNIITTKDINFDVVGVIKDIIASGIYYDNEFNKKYLEALL